MIHTLTHRYIYKKATSDLHGYVTGGLGGGGRSCRHGEEGKEVRIYIIQIISWFVGENTFSGSNLDPPPPPQYSLKQ